MDMDIMVKMMQIQEKREKMAREKELDEEGIAQKGLEIKVLKKEIEALQKIVRGEFFVIEAPQA